MSATTQCPTCNTRFKITQAQLDARQGMVRCGRCQAVFDARLYLQADISPPAAQADAPPVPPQDEPVAAAPEAAPPLPAEITPAEDEAARAEPAASVPDEPQADLIQPAAPGGAATGISVEPAVQAANVPQEERVPPAPLAIVESEPPAEPVVAAPEVEAPDDLFSSAQENLAEAEAARDELVKTLDALEPLDFTPPAAEFAAPQEMPATAPEIQVPELPPDDTAREQAAETALQEAPVPAMEAPQHDDLAEAEAALGTGEAAAPQEEAVHVVEAEQGGETKAPPQEESGAFEPQVEAAEIEAMLAAQATGASFFEESTPAFEMPAPEVDTEAAAIEPRQRNRSTTLAQSVAFDVSREEDQPAQKPAKKARAWPKPWLWALGSLFLLVAFVGEAAYFFRVELAATEPGLKPVLVSYCNLLRCSVPLPQKADLMDIESSELKADPVRLSVIALYALLRNHASYAQAYPVLELTLTDAQEKPLARRTFHPSDYLRPGEDETQGIAANHELNVKLNLDTTDLKPSGYRLLLYYPQ